MQLSCAVVCQACFRKPAPALDSVFDVIRNGIRPPTGALGPFMPAFGSQLSEADITALAKFVRARFSTRPPWTM